MQTNKAYVQSMYEAFGKGDIPFILNSISDDFTWSDPSNPAIAPQGGIYKSREGMGQFFHNLGSSIDTNLWEVTNIQENGDTVAAAGKHGGIVKATGKPFLLDWIMIWEFKNGTPVSGKSAFDAGTYELSFS